MDMSTEISTTLGQNFTHMSSVINESTAPPVIQFVIGVTGNIAALVILIKSSAEHQWRPFYRFVGGLIASDLSSMVFAYPFIITAYISNFKVVFSSAVCGYISFMLTFFQMTSAFTICIMSLDRFLALMCPLTYRNLSNGFRINLTLLGIWILAAIICGLPLIGIGNFRSYYPGSWCFFDFTSDDAKDKAFSYFYTVVGLLIIATTITLNSTVIVSMCWKIYNGETRSKTGKWNDISIVFYLVSVVTIFVVCTSPMMIQMLRNAATDDFEDVKVDLLTARLSVVNIMIDPWLYLLFKKRASIPFWNTSEIRGTDI